MRFLIDADLPRSIGGLITSYGHVAIDVRDIGLGRVDDTVVAAHAKANGLAIVTGDWGFADIRHFPPEEYAGIVVLELPDGATPAKILAIMRLLLDLPDVIALLPGRLAVVGRGKVRLRPAP